MKIKQRKKEAVTPRKKKTVKKPIQRAIRPRVVRVPAIAPVVAEIVPTIPLSKRIQHPPRKWRKPVSYFICRIFNLDPYRDFGILDELIGGLFVLLIAVTSITVIFGKEVTKTFVETSDTDWQKGAREHLTIIGTGTNASLGLEEKSGGWTVQERTKTNNITALTMLSTSSGWAVGESGMILRTNDGGVQWESVASATQDNLWGVSFANASLGFAVGDNGTILKWNGGAWSAVESPTPLSLLSVAVKGNKGFAVGEGGVILEWSGGAWSFASETPTDKFLNHVALATDLAFVVGEQGTILKWDGTTWTELTHGTTTRNLLSVKLLSPTFGIAVGEGGTILHWNGTSWSKKKSSGPDLSAVAIAATNAAIAGGNDATVLHWNGSSWSTDNLNASESIFGMALPSTSVGVALGSSGFAATYQGITYETEGTYTSAIKDAETEVQWDAIQWNNATPSGTSIRLQVAANNDKATWEYTGPDGTDATYYTNDNGQKITAAIGKKRYFRYRAFFKTTNAEATPLFHAATISAKEEIPEEPVPPKEEEKKVEPPPPPPPPEPKEPEKPASPPPEPTTPKTETQIPAAPSPTNESTTPSSSTTPTQTSSGGGGGITQRVITSELVEPTNNGLFQSDTPLVLKWAAAESTTTYTVQIDRTTSFTSPLVQTTVATTSYTHPVALTPGSYFWRVLPDVPTTMEKRADWSSAFTFTLTEQAPLPKVAAPTLSAPIGVDSSTVTLEGIAFPNATVRIIITSTIVERIVIADLNGAWKIEVPRSLFASGQHLAQAQVFTSGGQVTPAVTVGEFFIPFPPPPPKNAAVATARAIGKTAQRASDATKKAAKKTVETTAAVAGKTQEIIKENETSATVALSATVPVVTVANPSVLPMLSNLHVLFYHLFSGILSLFGIRKKRRPWGLVYDAITKEPVGLAIVRLFNAETKKLLETQVTDNDGRFGFLVEPGSYTIEAVKQDYRFSSKLITGKNDGDFSDCYHGEILKLGEGAINVSIPIDPVNKKEERQKQPFLITAKTVLHNIALPLLVGGWIASWLMTLLAYSLTNLAMTGVYLVFAVIHVLMNPKKLRPWGTVFAATTLEPVPLAVISIIDTKFNRVLKTRLTDYSGRFNFLPPAGQYKLSIKKEGFGFPATTKPTTHKFRNLYFGQDIIVKKEKAIVATDVPVEKR